MASFLITLGRFFTPPPLPDVSNYTGSEYRWKLFVFRPGLFQLEAYLAAGLVVYVLLFLVGSRMNKSRVDSWFHAHLPIIVPQFSRNVELQSDGHSDFFSFSTGRRHIASLHTIFKLRPRHDLLQIIYQTLRSGLVDLEYRPADTIELEFKLPDFTNVDSFVWAIVKKDQLVKVKQDRWDLTFTRTTDHPALTPAVSVMSEFADVTDTILTKTESGLAKLFKEGETAPWMPYFRSLSISDQPRSRPDQPLPASKKYKRVILSLAMPSNPEDTHDIVKAMFPFIDAIASKGLSLRPETKSKLRKVREELDVQLKADAEREKREEEEQAREDKKAAKKRAEEERVGKLSAAEQVKWREREKKKAMRKTQTKMVKK